MAITLPDLEDESVQRRFAEKVIAHAQAKGIPQAHIDVLVSTPLIDLSIRQLMGLATILNTTCEELLS